MHYHRVDATRAWPRSRSTRIQQVEDAGEKSEHRDSVGKGGGFLWGMDTCGECCGAMTASMSNRNPYL